MISEYICFEYGSFGYALKMKGINTLKILWDLQVHNLYSWKIETLHYFDDVVRYLRLLNSESEIGVYM